MASDRFDELTARLALPISRRRGVGLAGVLGLGGLGALQGADARKKKHKKHKKHKSTTTLPPDCGTCEGELVCRNGRCDCPEGKDLCGGACHPACPASTPGRVVARHPASCACCVRPGSFPCPDSIEQCCVGPDDLPCCAQACDPLAVAGECPEGIWVPPYGSVCHYDVECYPGSRCPAGNDPRKCEPIPG